MASSPLPVDFEKVRDLLCEKKPNGVYLQIDVLFIYKVLKVRKTGLKEAWMFSDGHCRVSDELIRPFWRERSKNKLDR